MGLVVMAIKKKNGTAAFLKLKSNVANMSTFNSFIYVFVSGYLCSTATNVYSFIEIFIGFATND